MSGKKRNTRKPLNVVGIMSGTSLDGIDFVLTRFDEKRTVYKDMASVSFTKKIKAQLEDLAEGRMSFRDGQLLHFRLGQFYQKSLERIASKKRWKIDLIRLHGQTVFHKAPFATTQIGEPSYMKSFGVPVVSDFRSKIISAGGQGAPLAPIFHEEICSKNSTEIKKDSWAFLNLGGMSNITCKKGSDLMATDLGPANIFLDKASQILLKKPFDKGGALALRGIPDFKIVKAYVKSESFFSKKEPKSCGREEFSDIAFKKIMNSVKKLSPEDKMATLAEITLWPIINFMKRHHVDSLIVSGGGVHNEYLMKSLRFRLSETEILSSEDLGWPSQAVEGGAFAHLAYLKYLEQPADLSYMGVTEKLSPLGRID